MTEKAATKSPATRQKALKKAIKRKGEKATEEIALIDYKYF